MADEATTATADSGDGTTNAHTGDGITQDQHDGRTFTQADLDRVVEDRLKRERQKFGDYETLKSKALKLDELEQSTKSEQEKLTDKLTGAEQRALQAEALALRLDVALEKAPEGMPIAQIRKLAKRLTGDSREDLEKDADELFADFAPTDDTATLPRRPRERLRTSSGAPVDAEPDPGLGRLRAAYADQT